MWNLNFEHYNGLLKSINTNRKDSFETTYMHGFLELGFADNFVAEKSRWFAGEPDFIKLLTRLAPQLSPPSIDPTINAAEFDLNTFVNYAEKWNGRLEVSGCEQLPPSTYPLDLKPIVPISDAHYDLLLKSDEARSKKGINIQALFLETDNNGDPVIRAGSQHTEMRYGRITYFFVHRIRIHQGSNTGYFDHTFAFVNWYAKSTDIASIAAQRSHGLMECILPIHRIFSPIAVAPNGPDKLVVIPLPRKTTG
ncbi:hypothetical protein INT45_000345 [Circinella minor]|uniref:Uncharacterized protein n=1 Tax=Circinella minor TaxID=1195481 RepID=A0A8H7RMR3_9FUNG|nr:hypothetical protein INT45_000345 [Circinella minor]